MKRFDFTCMSFQNYQYTGKVYKSACPLHQDTPFVNLFNLFGFGTHETFHVMIFLSL